MRKVATLLQRLPHHEHAEQEKYDVYVYGPESLSGRYLPGGQHDERPEQHRLPNLKTEPADPPDGDEDKNHQ